MKVSGLPTAAAATMARTPRTTPDDFSFASLRWTAEGDAPTRSDNCS